MRLSTLAALAAAGTMHAQQPAVPAAPTEFVVTRGSDTIATESVTRNGSEVKSDLLLRDRRLQER